MERSADPQFDDTLRMAAMRRSPAAGVKLWLIRLIEPHVLFPAITLLVMSVVWAATFNLIRVERADAQTAATLRTLDILNIYEAQVVRALREIDQALKLVKYVHETQGRTAALADLKSRALLPPELLFVVRIVNRDGELLASTRPAEAPPAGDAGYLAELRRDDSLWVGQPRQIAGSREWTLQFARRLEDADGAFSGAVLLSVDASYFVSGYDAAQFGKHGTLALLGTDGIFRARRSGDTLFAGDAVDYAAMVAASDQDAPAASLKNNAWDGVRRYTGARQLFEFPLAVIVGLAEDEQLAAAHHDAHIFLWRAAAGSGLLTLLTTLLGHMSVQLARGRERESEAKIKHAQRVEYLAYHDGLTGLPNRSLFNKLLGQTISLARRHSRQLAVAFIDLDRFKQINDTLGHEAGDELLREVAKRLKACLRDSDTVARLGGDEFVVLMTELGEEKYAATVARKLIAALATPFMLVGQEFRVTGSIGISTYPSDGLDEQTLTKNADIAMYKAKEEGKNNFQFYSEKLNAHSLERLALESSLRHALERSEFRLEYQARRDMTSGRITGAKAVLWWQHPDLGVVAPLQFIAVADETGLIVPIGKWVLRAACEQNVAWAEQGLPPLSIAVNLTARQFSDENLLRDIAGALESSGLDASLLEIEMPERLLIHDTQRTLGTLTALKAMGVKIAIDDFGTGYSSLATLQQFPLDSIKIDRSYIREVAIDNEKSNLTEAIIAMGKTLSLTVVAQGVETKEQVDFLREHACDEFQGFYLNTPLSASQFSELFKT